MGRANVPCRDLLLFHASGQFHGLDRTPVQEAFHRLAGRGFRGAAVVRFELKTGEHWRVVAGGDHHASNGALGFHREGHRRGGSGGWRQDNRKSIAGKNLSGALTELVREKPPVIADDDLFLCPGDRMRAPIVSGRLRKQIYGGESELLGDDRRGGSGGWRQDNRKSIAGKNLSGALTELVREKPPVIADDDLFLCPGDRMRAP